MTQLCFLNNWGVGDTFVSRSFVKDIIAKTEFDEYVYYHRHPKHVMKDLDLSQKSIADMPAGVKIDFGISDDRNAVYSNPNSRTPIIQGDTTYINTWYEASIPTGFEYRISNFSALSALFRHVYDKLGIQFPENDGELLPRVDRFQVDHAGVNKIFQTKDYDHHVLICNEEPMSGQALPFNYDVVFAFAQRFPNIFFMLSNPNISKRPMPENMGIFQDVIGYEDNMLEISHYSTMCRLIFSRCSGVSTCTLNYENIMGDDTRYVTYTKFMDLPYFYEKQKNVLSLVSTQGCEETVVSALYSELRNL